MSRPVAAALTAACILALPVAAHATGWPMLGGDPGHSGHQAADPPELPATLEWHAAEADAPQTGAVLTRAKEAADRRLAYGTSGDTAAHVRLRDLADGTDLATDGLVSADADAFGDGSEAVTPVDTSGDLPGQLFVLHNDDDSAAAEPAPDCTPLFPGTQASDNDIAIAQYDVATGDRVLDVAIGAPAGGQAPLLCDEFEQVTAGYSVDAAPVLSPPDSAGARSLFFVARRNAGGPGRLFRVDIPRPQDTDSGIEVVDPEHVDVPGLNSEAAPTLAYLQDPVSGTVELFVIVSRSVGPDLVAHRAADLSSRIESAELAGTPQTVTVPAGPNGALPSPAPVLYAAFDSAGGTVLRAFEQDGAGFAEALGETAVTGVPGPGLAADGNAVFVPTSEGLTRVDRATLDVEATAPGAFASGTPLVSGRHVFAQADDGSQVALTDALAPVEAADFTEAAENGAATSAVGQPAYASGTLAFLSDRGAFVYATGIAAPPPPDDGGNGGGPPPPNQAPTASFIFAPNPGKAGELVGFDASASKDPDGKIARYQWDLNGDGSFETDGGAKAGMIGIYPAGVHTVRLRVTDDRGATGETARQITVVGEAKKKRKKVRPRKVAFKVTPRHDSTAPYRFRVKGRLRAPKGVNRTKACRGPVRVNVKRGKRAVLRRATRVRRNCTFKAGLKFRDRSRIGSARKLRVVVRFKGNRVLRAKKAKSRVIRVG